MVQVNSLLGASVPSVFHVCGQSRLNMQWHIAWEYSGLNSLSGHGRLGAY